MTDRAEKFEFRAPGKLREVLKKRAAERSEREQRNVYPSDLMREAVEEWLSRQGDEMPLDVDRGGWRGNDARPADEPRRAAS